MIDRLLRLFADAGQAYGWVEYGLIPTVEYDIKDDSFKIDMIQGGEMYEVKVRRVSSTKHHAP